jgi:hypothetical protein
MRTDMSWHVCRCLQLVFSVFGNEENGWSRDDSQNLYQLLWLTSFTVSSGQGFQGESSSFCRWLFLTSPRIQLAPLHVLWLIGLWLYYTTATKVTLCGDTISCLRGARGKENWPACTWKRDLWSKTWAGTSHQQILYVVAVWYPWTIFIHTHNVA